MKVGITGHQRIGDDSKWPIVEDEMARVIRSCPQPVVGLSSLAIGADQRFAEIIVREGATLIAVVPFEGYERTFVDPDALRSFRRLLALSSRVETLNWHDSDESSFFAAGRRVADECELLVAVWNGKPAAGLGGTADVVRYAKSKGRSVKQINPDVL